MPDRPGQVRQPSSNPVYEDAFTTCHTEGAIATLRFDSKQSAGAIGQAQGQSLLHGLAALQSHSFHTLKLVLNSSGANFDEPLAGLFYLNAWIEALWQVRMQGVIIQVYCPGWLFGGMALCLATVAHEITLAPKAHMGLLGPKVTGREIQESIPLEAYEPRHLRLTRQAP